MDTRNARWLGTFCIIGSAIGVADSVRRVVLGQPLTVGIQSLDAATAMVLGIAAIGGLCGLLGLIALRVTGNHSIFRLLTYLPGISYVAALLASLGLLTGALTSDANNPTMVLLGVLVEPVGPAAWLVVAILTIAAKRWRGWRRMVPLMIVLAFPAGIIASLSTGLVGTFGLINYAAALLLGYAVQSSEAAAPLREAVA
jgi:hypothetical protein